MKLLGLAEEDTSREDVDQTMGRVGTWAKKEKLGLEKNSPKQARGSNCLRRRRKELARQGVSKDRRSEGKRMRLKIRK